jgi:aryl-alcohol dehydrogenase-like predicted oxidoreductase
MRFLQLAEKHDLPRAVSLQNPYSLLNRTLEIGLAEICLREEVSLLPYSPLAFGLLTDKYHNGSALDKARLTLFPTMARYNGENSRRAAEAYYQVAQEHNLSLAQLALAFQLHQPFVDSIIIGATRLDQLKENIDSTEISLSEEVLEAIEEVHEGNPNPAP